MPSDPCLLRDLQNSARAGETARATDASAVFAMAGGFAGGFACPSVAMPEYRRRSVEALFWEQRVARPRGLLPDAVTREQWQGGVSADANPAVPQAPEFPAGMVGYVAMVASLIEGRTVSEEEIVRMLVRAMRQHSMARRRRMDYVVAQLSQHGP